MFAKIEEQKSKDRAEFRRFCKTLIKLKVINDKKIADTPALSQYWCWDYIEPWMYKKTAKKEFFDTLFD